MIRLRPTSALVASAVAVFAATPLWAAESAEKKAGLPQLDMAYYPGQLFWLAVSFIVLYLLMLKVALPAVQRVQTGRQQTIARELATARAAHDEAKAVMAHVEQALLESRTKARTIVDAIQLDVTTAAAERMEQQQHELTRRLHDAEVRIVTARVAAIKDIQTMAGDLSTTIVERVSGLKSAVAMREGRA